MMKGLIGDFYPEVIVADGLYDFDRKLFGTEEMPSEEIEILHVSLPLK